MLDLLIERLSQSKQIHKIVIATTTESGDDCIEKICRDLQVSCFRGSSKDVLDRVLRAAQEFQASHIVEMTGDCPLLDSAIVDQIISLFFSGEYDYVSNIVERTYPRGLDTQIFPTAVLAEVAKITQDPADRENVSLFIYEHPERYRLGNLVAPEEIRRPDLRLTVDTNEDLALVTKIYESLYPSKPDFNTLDVITLLNAHPELESLNGQVKQKPVR
jgi:spore coat polysaccharide biosynthesis protein SpsF